MNKKPRSNAISDVIGLMLITVGATALADTPPKDTVTLVCTFPPTTPNNQGGTVMIPTMTLVICPGCKFAFTEKDVGLWTVQPTEYRNVVNGEKGPF